MSGGHLLTLPQFHPVPLDHSLPGSALPTSAEPNWAEGLSFLCVRMSKLSDRQKHIWGRKGDVALVLHKQSPKMTRPVNDCRDNIFHW